MEQKHNQQEHAFTIHNPADLLFSNLIGSTLHMDNKTNEQSTFKITSIWMQNIWTLVESAWIWTGPTEFPFFAFLLVQKVHVTTWVTLWETGN